MSIRKYKDAFTLQFLIHILAANLIWTQKYNSVQQIIIHTTKKQ